MIEQKVSTLINKAYELAEFCDVDVAVIFRSRKSGRYFTYNSVDLDSANRKLSSPTLKIIARH